MLNSKAAQNCRSAVQQSASSRARAAKLSGRAKRSSRAALCCSTKPSSKATDRSGPAKQTQSLPQPRSRGPLFPCGPAHCQRVGMGGVAGPYAAMDGGIRAYMDVLAAGPDTPPMPAQLREAANPSRCSAPALQLCSSAALKLCGSTKKNGRRSARSFISAKRNETPHHTLTRFSGARYSF